MSEEAFDALASLSPAELPAYAIEPQGISTLRLASAAYHSRTTDNPASTTWYPRLMDDVEIGAAGGDAIGVGGRLGLSIGQILLDDAGAALADLDRYGVADGRTARVRTIAVTNPAASDFGTAFASSVLVFSGVVRAVQRERGRRASLDLVDVTDLLSVPLQPVRYLGTGGLEGSDELKDKPKPITLGRVFNIPPVYLGNVDLGVGIGSLPTYQVHWRAVEEIAQVRIRGVVQTLTGGTPTVGQARAFASQGLFQLGSTPDGEVRADVRGDNVGSYVNSTAAVLRRLMQAHGPGFGDAYFDPISFAFAEVDLPGEIGWFQGPVPATAAQVCEQIVAASGAVLCGGRAGTVRLFDPIANDSVVQFELPAAVIAECQPAPLPLSLRPLPRAVAVGWRPNWAPLLDIAGTVSTAERERMKNDASGPERAESATVTSRVAIQRDLTLAGLYWAQADAAARAAKWRTWIEAGPRIFEIATDRYLGQIDCGAIGRITYPAWGLETSARVVVLGWREQIAARRLFLTVATLPEA